MKPNPLSERLEIRLTKDDRKAITKAAKRDRELVSEWVRRVLIAQTKEK
jgi:uncharacterized protein (DUF1778 family)